MNQEEICIGLQFLLACWIRQFETFYLANHTLTSLEFRKETIFVTLDFIDSSFVTNFGVSSKRCFSKKAVFGWLLVFYFTQTNICLQRQEIKRDIVNKIIQLNFTFM